MPLLLLFITIPILEIALLIKVGQDIGIFSTIALILLTAIIGASQVRLQGLQTLQRFRENLHNQKTPAMEICEGVLLLVSGVLLLTPGFFTDAIGFILLIPPLRRKIIFYWLAKRLDAVHTQHPGFTTREQDKAARPPIEGSYRRFDDEEK